MVRRAGVGVKFTLKKLLYAMSMVYTALAVGLALKGAPAAPMFVVFSGTTLLLAVTRKPKPAEPQEESSVAEALGLEPDPGARILAEIDASTVYTEEQKAILRATIAEIEHARQMRELAKDWGAVSDPKPEQTP